MDIDDLNSEWASKIVGLMFRCWISYDDLAKAYGISRQRVYQILHDKTILPETKQQLEEALRLCMTRKELPADVLFPRNP